MKNKTILPQWFEAEVYETGGIVTNPYSGESYELNKEELSMYDLISGLDYMTHCTDDPLPKKWSIVKRKALSWFRKSNSKAYFVLLD